MLNQAAVLPAPHTRICARALRILAVASGVALFVFLWGASSAFALDGIDLSSPPEPSAEGECSRLIQIKYPFLGCANGQIGQSDSDQTWDNSRQIPMGSRFVEGSGYYGDALNRD